MTTSLFTPGHPLVTQSEGLVLLLEPAPRGRADEEDVLHVLLIAGRPHRRKVLHRHAVDASVLVPEDRRTGRGHQDQKADEAAEGDDDDPPPPAGSMVPPGCPSLGPRQRWRSGDSGLSYPRRVRRSGHGRAHYLCCP